ncbi:uncharacterized protein C8R40DRAFT_1072412 [Lentinula edodes]|uniref:uncharacterized protein n=1 Tax=Lentinula edodes TaxID=5353 RepID=UPI001E8DC6B7|nr:uncharacterized protein C8R40DRAFT_1072412 [Lentinula edodes]KAH7871668.1 hypothetical protein C8R40DRAFT_1072412 [Lentinula edodes]
MTFSSTLLYINLAASLLLAVGAIPYDRSKLGISHTTLTLGTRDPAAAAQAFQRSSSEVPAGENSLVEKRKTAEQEFPNKWFGQLRCVGYGKNEETFKRTDLTTQIVDRKLLSKSGKFNQGVFTLPNHLDRVVKLVKLTGISPWLESPSCEVESLKAYGQSVTSGFAMLPLSEGDAQVGVIIMKKVDGTTFLNTEQWKSVVLTKKQKLNALDTLKRELEEVVYSSIREGKPLYSDFQVENVLIDAKNKPHLVDFGFPGVWPVKKVPTRDVFNEWFERRWYLLWGCLYTRLGGNIPITSSKPVEGVVRGGGTKVSLDHQSNTGKVEAPKSWSKLLLDKLGINGMFFC